MIRTIPLKIQNEYITGDKSMIGAAGSHNDVILRMEFSGMWDGLTKMVQFRDALGEATIEVLLTADMLEADDTSVYLVPVPNGAKKYAGEMTLCIKGAAVSAQKETRATLAVYGRFAVAESKWSADAETEADVPATNVERLQGQIENVLATIVDARKAATEAAKSEATATHAAETAAVILSGTQKAAQNASESAKAAEKSAQDASKKYTLASAAANDAATFSQRAASSATEAKASENAAADSAANAAASATSAGESASTASGKAANAANSASAAYSYAEDALTAASAAQASKRSAASSQNAAKLSENNAAASATAAAESIKHAPRISSSGKWELWDATKNAYVATEYTAVGKDGTRWWTYNGVFASLGEKIWVSYHDIPNASIGDFVLHTRNDAGVVYEITGRDALNSGEWLVEKRCVLKGTDGTTPHIGDNGNWYIGDTDTGVSAGGASYIFKVIVVTGPDPDKLSADKTFAEIKSAYASGSMVVVKQGTALYELTYVDNTKVEFTHVNETYCDVLSCTNSGAPQEVDIWQLNRTKRLNYDMKYKDIGLKTVPVAIKELQDGSAPAVTDADAGKYLHVNASTKKLEWAEAGGGTSLTKDSIVTALGYTPLNPSVDNVTLAVDGTHGLSLSSAYSMGLDITADMARMNMSPVGRGAVASPNPAIKFKGDASPTADFGNDKDVILTGIADGTEDNDAATVRQLKEYVASESPGWTGGDMIMMRDGDGFVGYAEMKPDTVGAMPVVPVNDAAKGKYLHVNASKELEWAGLSFTDDGSGNISVDGATEQSVNRFLQSLTFPGLNFKYINPLNSGTYSNPYGVYVGSGASLVDTILTKTVPGVYTVYMNRNATDVPAAAAAASSSLRGLVILSQIKKHYAIIMLVDQLSNFYVQYIQNDVGGGWKQMPTSDGGSDLPAVTAADAGKFLRVSSSGFWAAETVANANGGEF